MKLEIKEIVELYVDCPKDKWMIDPNDCEDCPHYIGETREGKNDYIICDYGSVSKHKRGTLNE